MKTKLPYILSVLFVLLNFVVFAQNNSYWKQISQEKITKHDRYLNTLNSNYYKTFELNIDALKDQISNAPLRSQLSGQSQVSIFLPKNDGDLEMFRVVEAPIFSDELAQLYPNIKTYIGYSADRPGVRARFSITPQGLQSMVTAPDGETNFVVPIEKGNSTDYITYSQDARSNFQRDFTCLTEDALNTSLSEFAFSQDANDQTLRFFRIAISTTGGYTTFWDDGNAGNGGPQEDALAQVASTLNRVIEVFEVDMAISFKLVSGTNIIYPNPSTDPYTSGSLNSQVQTVLTANVGESNYDVGHLFESGFVAGNAGCIGCVCVNGAKGRGWSAHNWQDNDGGPYMSDFFDINIVPHEIGHQLGANHTYSFISEGTGVNVEPGSGTTIMGYAGITGVNDVQDHADPYFHHASINQILNNLNVRTCWAGSGISNNPPVANAGSDFSIPQGTAFILKGAATDPDGSDVLYYTWDQIDSGVTTFSSFGPTKTTGALWRSRPPSASPDRYMPNISRVIAGELTETNPVETTDNTSWETVSTVSRELNFALTVRDRSEANGTRQFPQTSFDFMQITVDGAAGPFVVTSQSTSETWNAGSTQTITWDVAGTNAGTINVTSVNILLSLDGGNTFPITLASNVANDGSENITLPTTGVETSSARIKVEAVGNIFYAINSTNITIEGSLSIEDENAFIFSIYPNPNFGTFTIQGNFIVTNLNLNVFDIRGRLVNSQVINSNGILNETVTLSNVAAGLYFVKLSEGNNTFTEKIIVTK